MFKIQRRQIIGNFHSHHEKLQTTIVVEKNEYMKRRHFYRIPTSSTIIYCFKNSFTDDQVFIKQCPLC